MADSKAIGDVLAHRHVREESIALKHHVGRALFRTEARDIDAVDLDRTRAGLGEAADDPKQRRLAAPGGPEQRIKIAAVDVEVERFDGGDVAVVLGDAAEPDAAAALRTALWLLRRSCLDVSRVLRMGRPSYDRYRVARIASIVAPTVAHRISVASALMLGSTDRRSMPQIKVGSVRPPPIV